jgi:hypothetical protein
MVTRRVVIGNSGGASPFIVTVVGVNADSGAQFDNLIFDANQAPLKIYINGYMTISPISQSDSSGGITVKLAGGPSSPAVPPGTHALFLMCWRQPNTDSGNTRYGGGNGVVLTPQFASSNSSSGQGAGGTMEPTIFIGSTFARPILLPSGFWTGFPADTIIDYCIFSNYQ